MKRYFVYILLLLCAIVSACKNDDPNDILEPKDFDTFQESGMWAIADLNPYCTYYYQSIRPCPRIRDIERKSPEKIEEK